MEMCFINIILDFRAILDGKFCYVHNAANILSIVVLIGQLLTLNELRS
jgi:hypothetical protein